MQLFWNGNYDLLKKKKFSPVQWKGGEIRLQIQQPASQPPSLRAGGISTSQSLTCMNMNVGNGSRHLKAALRLIASCPLLWLRWLAGLAVSPSEPSAPIANEFITNMRVPFSAHSGMRGYVEAWSTHPRCDCCEIRLAA